jgi:hypothetical protein
VLLTCEVSIHVWIFWLVSVIVKLSGGIVSEEALDLSSERLVMMKDKKATEGDDVPGDGLKTFERRWSQNNDTADQQYIKN